MAILRNFFAVVLGWIGGSCVNMFLVSVGHGVFPVEGMDTQNMQQMAEIFPTLAPKHFLFPFLAHAIGTLTGALIAYDLAASRKQIMAYVIGGFFLMGGIMVNMMIPGPIWFSALDIVVAYIPMAWFAGRLMNMR